ncbi:MAG TPA: thioesterase [Microscillaceae bacterium]|nr:thioesterase [Microscillaceae bacterium]
MFDFRKDYPKITESRAIIRFQDCDPLGHLNNAKYLDYFFNAREDQIPQVYEINPVDFFKKFKAGWVIYNHQIAYLRSALPGEWVRILSSVIFFNHDTVVTEYVMTDESKHQLKAVMWTTQTYIDSATGKRMNHHEEVMQFLGAIALRDFDFHPNAFQDRIKQIKQTLLNQA